MEGGGFLGRAHPGFAKTVQRLHSPAARLGEPGWWRPREFLRETLPEDFLTPHSWATRSHVANSPRDPGSLAVGLDWIFRICVSSARHEFRKFIRWLWTCGLACPEPPADGGGVDLGGTMLLRGDLMDGRALICQLSSPFMPLGPGGRSLPSDGVASIVGMTRPIWCLAWALRSPFS